MYGKEKGRHHRFSIVVRSRICIYNDDYSVFGMGMKAEDVAMIISNVYLFCITCIEKYKYLYIV